MAINWGYLTRVKKMPIENIDSVIATFNWINPKTKQHVRLGNYIGKERFVNSDINTEQETALLENPKNGLLISAGKEGKIYLHDMGGRKRVVKHYHKISGRPYSGMCTGTGISQFRCMRKINLLEFESPVVYAASLDTIVMDYLPYAFLEKYMNGISPQEQVKINLAWLEMTRKIHRLLPSEKIDPSPKNGYFKQNGILGIIDYG